MSSTLSGPQKGLLKLGLLRDIDLVLHLPLRYEDETRLISIQQAPEGTVAQIQGTVIACDIDQRQRRQLLVRIQDAAGDSLLLRFLHFYTSQTKAYAVGALLRVNGTLRSGLWGKEMVHPTVKIVQPNTPLSATLTPIYPTVVGLPQVYLRKAITAALARLRLAELVPAHYLPQLTRDSPPTAVPSLQAALGVLHQPPPTLGWELEQRDHPAWQRLKFEELLAQQISQLQARQERDCLRAPMLKAQPGGLHEKLLASLPFQLTQAQYRVSAEIAQDLARPRPMHRLLQGDVGSGKTVVAAVAAAIAMDANWQSVLMAPTEILAEQHFRKLVNWLTPLGIEVAWLTGSQRSKQRQHMLERIRTGQAQLIVGTHAVIQETVVFSRLGLVLIDEQHRFGVAQRLQLRDKLTLDNVDPHMLMMSATPIPRTLAMTYYADLDVSTLDELPPGRTPVVTRLFHEDKRALVLQRVCEAVAQGQQVYWVCPLIEESEEGGAAAVPLSLQNVTDTHQLLSQALNADQVGLLHGRMKATDKATTMQAFAVGELRVLVATTVIEVGVDVPNASLMVIEHAERFGLSQLHQLRGRVGRGLAVSACVLLYSRTISAVGKERLKAMVETQDGFEIARRDLDIRGPGEFLGARQSGANLLRFADAIQDAALVTHARQVAPLFLQQYPQAAQEHVERWLGSKAVYLKA